MIRVSLTVLVLIYLSMMLGPVFFFWLLNEWRKGRRERAAFRHALRCGLCAFEFEDKSDALLPRCPRCGALTERYPLSRV